MISFCRRWATNQEVGNVSYELEYGNSRWQVDWGPGKWLFKKFSVHKPISSGQSIYPYSTGDNVAAAHSVNMIPLAEGRGAVVLQIMPVRGCRT